jgi:predicted amidophosphoribosyltransferase
MVAPLSKSFFKQIVFNTAKETSRRLSRISGILRTDKTKQELAIIFMPLSAAPFLLRFFNPSAKRISLLFLV